MKILRNALNFFVFKMKKLLIKAVNFCSNFKRILLKELSETKLKGENRNHNDITLINCNSYKTT